MSRVLRAILLRHAPNMAMRYRAIKTSPDFLGGPLTHATLETILVSVALHQAQQGRATIAVQALGYQARSHRKDFPDQKIERRQVALVVHRAFGIRLFVRLVFALPEVGSALEQLA